jgi:PhnB protein
MHVLPYLFFDGRCQEALDFYGKAIGAKTDSLMRFGDSPDKSMVNDANKNNVMHAQFKLGDTTIFVSDGMAKGNPKFDGFSLTIAADGEVDGKRYFNALADGGAVSQPLIETFFAKLFGMVKDKFGVNWMIIVQKAPG